jgi:hypothetical protein
MKMAKHQMKWRFIADNSKENAEIAVKLDINRSNAKIEEIGSNGGNASGSIYCT